jgi:hypothetical protein
MQFNIECQLCVELHVSQGAKEPCKGGSAHSKNGEKEMDMEMDTN